MAKKKPGKGKKAKKVKPMSEPAHWQERHAPTEAVMNFDHGKQTASGARRRVSEADIDRALDQQQREAREQLEAGYRAFMSPVAIKLSSVEVRCNPSPRYGTPSESIAADKFQRWSIACSVVRPMVDYLACVDVAVHGLPFTSVERDAKKRHGWAVIQLRRGLDLWWSVDRMDTRRAATEAQTAGLR